MGHLWMAVVLSAVAFGLARADEGGAGVLRTGIAVRFFPVPILLTNSLVPA
jgi:hypothetical protein